MARPTGPPKRLRATNESAALGHRLDGGSLPHGDLRELAGLFMPITPEVLRRLTKAGLAIIVGHASGGPGPKAEIHATHPEAAYAVAVSVRETTATGRPLLAVAATDLTGTVRSRAEIPVDLANCGATDAITAASPGGVPEAASTRPGCATASLGVPGCYHPRTDKVHHVDVPGLDRPGLAGEPRQRLGTDVGADNGPAGGPAMLAELARRIARGLAAVIAVLDPHWSSWLARSVRRAVRRYRTRRATAARSTPSSRSPGFPTTRSGSAPSTQGWPQSATNSFTPSGPTGATQVSRRLESNA